MQTGRDFLSGRLRSRLGRAGLAVLFLLVPLTGPAILLFGGLVLLGGGLVYLSDLILTRMDKTA